MFCQGPGAPEFGSLVTIRRVGPQRLQGPVFTGRGLSAIQVTVAVQAATVVPDKKRNVGQMKGRFCGQVSHRFTLRKGSASGKPRPLRAAPMSD